MLMGFAVSVFANLDPVTETSRLYQVDSKSSYDELLRAARRARKDIKAYPTDAGVALALIQIGTYIRPSQRILFDYDFGLQESDIASRNAALGDILNAVEAGGKIDPALQRKIADTICTELRSMSARVDGESTFAFDASKLLLYWGDDRGADMFLTGKEGIRNLQIADNWDSDSNADVFEKLSEKYTGLIGKKPGAKEYAVFYALCAHRKEMGDKKIEVKQKIFDFDGIGNSPTGK